MAHHHHHTVNISGTNEVKIYVFAIVLNLLFVLVEGIAGLIGSSLGLIADAGHNLSDVFSLCLALIAVKLAMTHGNKRFTYGYRKSSVLISLLNAIILLVAVGGIVVESISRLNHLEDNLANGELITWTAGVGIFVNGLTTWLLAHKRRNDINSRGAYLHMLADTLVSVGVVVSGIIITYTGWALVDPIISLVIAVIILISTCKLLLESVRMTIDAVPEGINTDEIVKNIESHSGVINVHHVHIWAISTTEIALTAHIVIDNKDDMERLTENIRHSLLQQGIHHSTLELETSLSHCTCHSC